MQNLNITQLRYVLALNEIRHFGKAARACSVTQPTLSMQIQKLEEEIGFVLFDRSKKPILPTDKGQKFIEQAQVILREVEKLETVSRREEGTVAGNFRLGIIPTLAPYLVPRFLSQFAKKYPNVDLTIDELKTEEIITSLNKEEIDAGLLVTPLKEKNIRERVLFYEPFYLYVSKTHALFKKKKIQESDLESQDVWLLNEGHCFRDQILKICTLKNQSGVFKNVYFQGGNLETLKRLVEKSGGYTFLPYLAVKDMKVMREMIRAFSQPIPVREVSLVHQRDDLKEDIIEALEEDIIQTTPKELTHYKKAEIDIIEI